MNEKQSRFDWKEIRDWTVIVLLGLVVAAAGTLTFNQNIKMIIKQAIIEAQQETKK